MTEAEKRLHRCAFTGHRPEKLTKPEYEIKAALEKEIRRAIGDGFTVFITGMARGVDLWAAQIVLHIRDKEGENLKLICAVPYMGFNAIWSQEDRDMYHAVLSAADLVRYLASGYSHDVFQRRNEWMVDRAARLIAAYNGTPGGTRNTIEYAKRKGVPCTFLR